MVQLLTHRAHASSVGPAVPMADARNATVQRLSHDPITGDSVLRSACDPVIHGSGTRVAGLRLTGPRAQALLHILLIFRLHPGGFLNKDPRSLLGEYLGRPPHGILVAVSHCGHGDGGPPRASPTLRIVASRACSSSPVPQPNDEDMPARPGGQGAARDG